MTNLVVEHDNEQSYVGPVPGHNFVGSPTKSIVVKGCDNLAVAGHGSSLFTSSQSPGLTLH